MSIIFNIKKLGPVRDSKIEFKPFLLFTGESNTGKSYVSLLVYATLKYLSEKLDEFVKKNFIHELERITKQEEKVKISIVNQEFNKWINKKVKFFLEYLLNIQLIDYQVDIQVNFDDIDFSFSYYIEKAGKLPKHILVENNTNKTIILHSIESIPVLIKETIADRLSMEVFGNKAKQTLLLPPAKSAMINQTSIDNLGLGLYKEFLIDYDIIKNTFTINSPENIEIVNRFILKQLGGDITETDEGIFYRFNEQEIPISAVASSIRELTPFLIAIRKLPPDLFSILFEEPESHLHPQIIIGLANLIVTWINKGCFLQITTHSDLFIAQINNLIRLDFLEKNQPDKFKEFKKRYKLKDLNILSPEKINAYFFKKIKNGETKIIKQSIEDGISLDSFSKAFNKIYEQTNFIDELLQL